MDIQFSNSVKHLDSALEFIPTGSQTFSKSYYCLPKGGAPLYLKSGKGAIATDIDGNEYIDLVNGLLSISLGYCDEDVDQAIRAQLSDGISFSLPIEGELKLARTLNRLIPSAEMIRFGKNGSDATSAAIRVARAVTGREQILSCGYHGWHDWYIGATPRKLGVPKTTQDLTTSFPYNSLDELEKLFAIPDRPVAAVIMEPMNTEYPKIGYLEGVRRLCDENGALLIFDEIITGFRFSLGGAQSLFNVTPDLSTFGKGLGNGMPISAIVGKRKYMEVMDDIFFSGTFGGEALSIAASLATIKKMEEVDFSKHMLDAGNTLAKGIERVINENEIDWFSLSGHPSWKIHQFNAGDETENLLYKSVFIQEMAKEGVLTTGSNNISLAIDDSLVSLLIKKFEKVLLRMNEKHKENEVKSLQVGELVKPVFKVR